MTKYLQLSASIILITLFYFNHECFGASNTSAPVSSKPDLISKIITNGDDLAKCFPGVRDRVNGSIKVIQDTVMSLLSTRPLLDSFVFNLTKALGAKAPTEHATEMPDHLNDQTPEILKVSNLFPVMAAAEAIYRFSQRGNASLVNFNSTVATYIKLSTEYVNTLLMLLQRPNLKKFPKGVVGDIIKYTHMLSAYNAELLAAKEQLEDLYLRPNSESGCGFDRRLNWATQSVRKVSDAGTSTDNSETESETSSLTSLTGTPKLTDSEPAELSEYTLSHDKGESEELFTDDGDDASFS